MNLQQPILILQIKEVQEIMIIIEGEVVAEIEIKGKDQVHKKDHISQNQRMKNREVGAGVDQSLTH